MGNSLNVEIVTSVSGYAAQYKSRDSVFLIKEIGKYVVFTRTYFDLDNIVVVLGTP